MGQHASHGHATVDAHSAGVSYLCDSNRRALIVSGPQIQAFMQELRLDSDLVTAKLKQIFLNYIHTANHDILRMKQPEFERFLNDHRAPQTIALRANDLFSILSCRQVLMDFREWMLAVLLLDHRCPHATDGPSGCLRLSLIFKYYDRGSKGHLDHFDLESLFEDVSRLQHPTIPPAERIPTPSLLNHLNHVKLSLQQFHQAVVQRRIRGTSQLLRIRMDTPTSPMDGRNSTPISSNPSDETLPNSFNTLAAAAAPRDPLPGTSPTKGTRGAGNNAVVASPKKKAVISSPKGSRAEASGAGKHTDSISTIQEDSFKSDDVTATAKMSPTLVSSSPVDPASSCCGSSDDNSIAPVQIVGSYGNSTTTTGRTEWQLMQDATPAELAAAAHFAITPVFEDLTTSESTTVGILPAAAVSVSLSGPDCIDIPLDTPAVSTTVRYVHRKRLLITPSRYGPTIFSPKECTTSRSTTPSCTLPLTWEDRDGSGMLFKQQQQLSCTGLVGGYYGSIDLAEDENDNLLQQQQQQQQQQQSHSEQSEWDPTELCSMTQSSRRRIQQQSEISFRLLSVNDSRVCGYTGGIPPQGLVSMSSPGGTMYLQRDDHQQTGLTNIPAGGIPAVGPASFCTFDDFGLLHTTKQQAQHHINPSMPLSATTSIASTGSSNGMTFIASHQHHHHPHHHQLHPLSIHVDQSPHRQQQQQHHATLNTQQDLLLPQQDASTPPYQQWPHKTHLSLEEQQQTTFPYQQHQQVLSLLPAFVAEKQYSSSADLSHDALHPHHHRFPHQHPYAQTSSMLSDSVPISSSNSYHQSVQGLVHGMMLRPLTANEATLSGGPFEHQPQILDRCNQQQLCCLLPSSSSASLVVLRNQDEHFRIPRLNQMSNLQMLLRSTRSTSDSSPSQEAAQPTSATTDDGSRTAFGHPHAGQAAAKETNDDLRMYDLRPTPLSRKDTDDIEQYQPQPQQEIQQQQQQQQRQVMDGSKLAEKVTATHEQLSSRSQDTTALASVQQQQSANHKKSAISNSKLGAKAARHHSRRSEVRIHVATRIRCRSMPPPSKNISLSATCGGSLLSPPNSSDEDAKVGVHTRSPLFRLRRSHSLVAHSVIDRRLFAQSSGKDDNDDNDQENTVLPAVSWSSSTVASSTPFSATTANHSTPVDTHTTTSIDMFTSEFEENIDRDTERRIEDATSYEVWRRQHLSAVRNVNETP